MPFGPPEYASSPLHGMDFCWLAVDRDDHVAWLVTFGSAVVPAWIERAAESLADVEASLGALPERGAALPPAARRGVFAYDWKVHVGPYERVAMPVAPVSAGDLPAALCRQARLARFEHLCFAQAPELRVADVVASRPGP